MLRRCLEARKLETTEGEDVAIQPEFLQMLQTNADLVFNSQVTRQEEERPRPPEGKVQDPQAQKYPRPAVLELPRPG